jgi:hypothetical protein
MNETGTHVGALYMQANVNPTNPDVAFTTDGANGRNHYRDYAFDGSYQFVGDGTHIVTALGHLYRREPEPGGLHGSFQPGEWHVIWAEVKPQR